MRALRSHPISETNRVRRVGIVGAEASKFLPVAEEAAKRLILRLLQPEDITLVSGGCHLGGIDIWAEEIAVALSRPKIIHRPRVREWTRGYKPRNLKIARDADIVHNIVAQEYPPTYKGMHFEICYHCAKRGRERGVTWIPHVKSGGCWTAMQAENAGKQVWWHIVSQRGLIQSYVGEEG